MKLRLAIFNLLLPLSGLLLLLTLPTSELELADYIPFVLTLVVFGRAFLLMHQQAVFAMLPILLMPVPHWFGWDFNLDRPFALYSFIFYLLWVNLQQGQRPWFHVLHLTNFLLLFVFVVLAMGWLPIPDTWQQYSTWQLQWFALVAALVPLSLVALWSRIGRWAAYWPLVVVVLFQYNWAPDEYLVLWFTFASLFSLTLDSYVLAYVDELTGILGRRALTFKLKTIGKHYYLAMLDVDHFKKFNDNHGHLVGDDVLKIVAKVIGKTASAIAYRYGGEEFALLFRGGNGKEVEQKLEATRQAIAEYPMYVKGRKRHKNQRGKGSERKALYITASFGLTQHKQGERHEQVIARADKALYQAKKQGRNCLVVR